MEKTESFTGFPAANDNVSALPNVAAEERVSPETFSIEARFLPLRTELIWRENF